MTPNDFAYWLKGYFELSGSSSLNSTQVTIVKDHLDLVFKKETPDRSTKCEGTISLKDIEDMWGVGSVSRSLSCPPSSTDNLNPPASC